jgi:hypothetical protein
MLAMSWELREIAHQRQFDHLGRKSRALGIDKFALEFLTEQHGTQFLAHLFQELRPNPRAFAADDLDPLDVGAVLPVFVEMPALAVGEDISISRPFETASIGSSAACIASLTKAASSLMISFGAE